MTTYAVANSIPKDCAYLTAGKEYLVTEQTFDFFQIEGVIDGWPIYFRWNNCQHLCGGSWKRVEK